MKGKMTGDVIQEMRCPTAFFPLRLEDNKPHVALQRQQGIRASLEKCEKIAIYIYQILKTCILLSEYLYSKATRVQYK